MKSFLGDNIIIMMMKHFVYVIFILFSGCQMICAQQFVTQHVPNVPFDTITDSFYVRKVEKVSSHVYMLKLNRFNARLSKYDGKSISDVGSLDAAICDTLGVFKKVKRIKKKICEMTIVSLFPTSFSPSVFEKIEANYYDTKFSFGSEAAFRQVYYVKMLRH